VAGRAFEPRICAPENVWRLAFIGQPRGEWLAADGRHRLLRRDLCYSAVVWTDRGYPTWQRHPVVTPTIGTAAASATWVGAPCSDPGQVNFDVSLTKFFTDPRKSTAPVPAEYFQL